MKILFVCLGNICRSPLAEGVFAASAAGRGLGERFGVDSAGTSGWHVGSPPDPRSVAVAARHGIDISGQACRKVAGSDFDRFDLILAMDGKNRDDLLAMAPREASGRIHRFLDFATGKPGDVPDPYYGDSGGFEDVYRMIRAASEAMLDRMA